MKWWGWGDPHHHAELPPAGARGAARGARRAGPHVPRRCRSRTCALAEPRSARRARSGGCGDAVGEEWVRQDRLTRVTHAAGKGYPDLVRMRAGARRERARTRSCIPASAGRGAGGARRVRRGGRRRRPVRRRHERRRRRRAAARRPMTAVICLDLGRIDHARDGRHALADRRARRRPARARGRARARAARASRSATSRSRGSTRRVGGWVATRSAGQASTGYGSDRQARRRAALRRAGGRDRRCAPMPATAAGPGPAPAAGRLGGRAGRDHRGHAAGAARCPTRPTTRAGCSSGFEQGAEAFRALEQGHVIPDVARLSDEDETRQSLTLSDGGLAARQRAGRALHRRARLRGRLPRDPRLRGRRGRTSTSRRARARRILRRGGGLALGAAPGRAWLRAALRGPVPARRAARPRHHGGDARDGGALVGPDAASTRRSRDAIARRARGAAARPGS